MRDEAAFEYERRVAMTGRIETHVDLVRRQDQARRFEPATMSDFYDDSAAIKTRVRVVAWLARPRTPRVAHQLEAIRRFRTRPYRRPYGWFA